MLLEHYGMEVKNLKLICSHFGIEIFLIETDKGKYIVKTLPLDAGGIENEGYITDYLYNNDINVPRLLKTNSDIYHVKTDKMQVYVREFVEGETLQVSTAPEWFLEKSACTLGKINKVLKDFGELKTNFGEGFFQISNVIGSKNYYSQQLNEAIDKKDLSLVSSLKERIKHLEKISSFNIDVSKLTYANSHGDFYIGQIITNNKNLTVIDWDSACKLPVSLEVIMSYVSEDPECRYGKIDSNRLKQYIAYYLKYFSLNPYDIKMMPYVLYFQQIMCHYAPPYDNIPDDYKPLCKLVNNYTNWLYENVETLSDELCKVNRI